MVEKSRLKKSRFGTWFTSVLRSSFEETTTQKIQLGVPQWCGLPVTTARLEAAVLGRICNENDFVVVAMRRSLAKYFCDTRGEHEAARRALALFTLVLGPFPTDFFLSRFVYLLENTLGPKIFNDLLLARSAQGFEGAWILGQESPRVLFTTQMAARVVAARYAASIKIDDKSFLTTGLFSDDDDEDEEDDQDDEDDNPKNKGKEEGEGKGGDGKDEEQTDVVSLSIAAAAAEDDDEDDNDDEEKAAAIKAAAGELDLKIKELWTKVRDDGILLPRILPFAERNHLEPPHFSSFSSSSSSSSSSSDVRVPRLDGDGDGRGGKKRFTA